jgi:tetratricopeptide (TPR) repeat protein
MKNRNKSKLCFGIGIALCFFQLSCATNLPEKSTINTDEANSIGNEIKPITTEKAIAPTFTPENFIAQLSVLLKKGDMDAALKSFETVPLEYKDHMDLNFIHASLLLSANKITEAEIITNALIEKDGENSKYLNLAMLIAKEKGDITKKQLLLSKILNKDPYNTDANIELANTQMLQKKYPLAKNYYLKALSGDSKNEEALFGYGQTCYYLNNLDDAKSSFEQLIKIDSSNSMAWSYLGKLYAETEDYKEAIPCAQKAVELDPDYYHHWIELSNYYRLIGKYDQAIEALDHAIKINPSYFLAYVYRAGINDQEGNRSEALKDYMNIVKYKPDYYFAYESIGILAWGEKNWHNARVGFMKAYEAKPDNISYPLMIAATYLKEGNNLECKNFLSTVLKTLDRKSIDYSIVRLYWDNLGDESVLLKVTKLDNATNRGKYLFYMALWYELQGHVELAQKYYLVVKEMQCPMFFEYRLCEWALEGKSNATN